METGRYILLGAVWIVLCLVLGLQVRGWGRNHQSLGLGFKAMFLSWLLALCFLFFAITKI